MGVKVLGFAGNRPTSPIFYLPYLQVDTNWGKKINFCLFKK